MKLVYLDQNHWIELARAALGQTTQRHSSSLLSRLDQARIDGRACFPLSLAHYIETLKQRDPERRQRLANYMLGLSDGRTLAPPHVVLRHEIEIALAPYFPGRVSPRPLQFLGTGLTHAADHNFDFQLDWPIEASKSSNREKARHLLKLREGAIARGDRIVVETISYDDAVKMLVSDYERNEQSSLNDALGRIKHLTFYFSGIKLAQITTARIRDYQKQRLTHERIVSRERAVGHHDGTVTIMPEVRRKPSNAQINRETSVLGRMFSLAKQDDLIVSRPYIPKLEEPKQPNKGFFEYPDFVKVRDQLDPPFRNVAAFMYVTGWRIKSEVLALNWHQVDFTAGEVRLDAGTTKSGEPRVFPFTTDLQDVLQAQRRLTESLTSDAVFCHVSGVRAGQRLSYGGFFNAWLRAGRAAGVTRVPHDFRRTAIRNLERDGVARSVAMATVGHQTQEVYTRYAIVDEAMIREAAVKMNRGAEVRRSTAHCTTQSTRLRPKILSKIDAVRWPRG